MSPTFVNPPALHDPVPFGYSHAVAAPPGDVVFVAGQYASDADGQVAAGDFAAQVRLAVDNLRTVLAATGCSAADVVQLRTSVVDHDATKLEAIGGVLHGVWGDALPTQTLVGVHRLALPGMLFEIDAVAVRPAGR